MSLYRMLALFGSCEKAIVTDFVVGALAGSNFTGGGQVGAAVAAVVAVAATVVGAAVSVAAGAVVGAGAEVFVAAGAEVGAGAAVSVAAGVGVAAGAQAPTSTAAITAKPSSRIRLNERFIWLFSSRNRLKSW